MHALSAKGEIDNSEQKYITGYTPFEGCGVENG
jgi:hypothetical protein